MNEKRLQEIERWIHLPACDDAFGKPCICGAAERVELIAEVRRLQAQVAVLREQAKQNGWGDPRGGGW